jgi:hypothetical protein
MPHLPPISPDRMGELKTLGQICDHLGSQAAQPAEDLAATSPPESATEETGRVPTAVIRQDLLFEEAPFARGEKAQYPENTTLYIVGQGTGAERQLADGLTRQGVRSEALPIETFIEEATVLSPCCGLVLFAPN